VNSDPQQRLAYSIEEVARMAGCGRDTIYRALREGRLQAKKLGRLTRIPADEAKRFVASLPDAPLRRRDDG
jgi:excisionase family DNA binding protein